MKYWTFLLIFALVLGMAGLTAPLFSGSPAEADTGSVCELPFPPSFDRNLRVRVLKDGETVSMSLRDYLIGVLAAEMPSDFPPEALKAQAVAARTFTLHQMEACKHPGGAVCTDSRCCQGWSPERPEPVIAAVDATDGLAAVYGGKLIDATFFSCTGGRTEDARAVWGSDVPYLRSVESPGEETAPRYRDTVELEPDFFAETLCRAYPEMDLSSSPETWMGEITRTKGGGIATAVIGGVPVSGRTLRRLFALRSTDMDFDMEENSVRITTHGFGHRVGLSQYGARAMAEAGKDFTEILLHYYEGIKILRLRGPEIKKASSLSGRGNYAFILRRYREEKQ